MGDYIGIGKESASGPPSPPRFFPVIPFGSDVCEECGAIRPHSELEFIDSTEDGEPRYRCKDGKHA